MADLSNLGQEGKNKAKQSAKDLVDKKLDGNKNRRDKDDQNNQNQQNQ